MGSLLNRLRPRFYALQLRWFYRFSVRPARSEKKRLLVVKNDSIGDYIISRNFLAEIKRSDRFKDHELFFLTNARLAQIASDLDGQLFKEILIAKTHFSSVPEQLEYFHYLKSFEFECVLHPTYSPDSRTQHLIKFIAAPFKIGFSGDTSNQTQEDKANFEKYYTELIHLKKNFTHEFEKSRIFFEQVLRQKISFKKPELKPVSPVEKKKQIAICPGAQHAFRIWSLQKAGELITRLHHIFPEYAFVVVVGPGEEALYEGISAATPVELSCFKIDSILNLVALISASRLVVCNDSSAAHIAVAADVNSVCVSNGNHFRRFIPYPHEMHVKQQVVLPPKLLSDLKNGQADKYYEGSQLDINEITVNLVAEACELYLNK